MYLLEGDEVIEEAKSVEDFDVCGKGDGLYADKSRDCRFYFKCIFTQTRFSRKIEMSCPKNMYFNDIEKECTTKKAC